VKFKIRGKEKKSRENRGIEKPRMRAVFWGKSNVDRKSGKKLKRNPKRIPPCGKRGTSRRGS